MTSVSSSRPRPVWSQRPGPNPLVNEAPPQKGESRSPMLRPRLTQG